MLIICVREHDLSCFRHAQFSQRVKAHMEENGGVEECMKSGENKSKCSRSDVGLCVWDTMEDEKWLEYK